MLSIEQRLKILQIATIKLTVSLIASNKSITDILGMLDEPYGDEASVDAVKKMGKTYQHVCDAMEAYCDAAELFAGGLK